MTMYLRVAAGVATMAAVPITGTVFAAEVTQDAKQDAVQDSQQDAVQAVSTEKQQKTPEKQTTDNRLYRHQLPIYGQPAPAQIAYIPEKIGVVQENVVPVREVLLTGIARCEKFINFASETEAVVSSNLKDLVRYLREDAGAIPRATFITVSGLGGLVAGYRGGIFRKMVYATIGMGGAASVCYPQQSIDLSKRGWILTKQQAIELWNQNVKTTDKSPKKDDSKVQKVEEKFNENIDKLSKGGKDTIKTIDKGEASVPVKVDHGMSKPEDKDMYSTRTS